MPLQSGRHFVVLSLVEAEALRGVMHMKGGLDLPSTSMAALRILTSTGIVTTDAWTKDGALWNQGPGYQRAMATQCFRFLDSETEYPTKLLNVLMRAMQPNECEARKDFWMEVRSCRRRKQTNWQRAAVAKVFTTADEYKLLEHRATCARVSDLIIGKGMFVMDAFRAFDSSNKVSDAAPMFMRFPIVSVANPILHPCFLLLRRCCLALTCTLG